MAANPNDVTEVVPYLTSGVTIFVIQQWMKRRYWYGEFVKHFPGIDKYAHWFMAGVMSFAASTGIHAVWSGTFSAGGTIVITVPTALALLHGLSDWYKVYILQHGMYLLKNPPAYLPAPKPVEGDH